MQLTRGKLSWSPDWVSVCTGWEEMEEFCIPLCNPLCFLPQHNQAALLQASIPGAQPSIRRGVSATDPYTDQCSTQEHSQDLPSFPDPSAITVQCNRLRLASTTSSSICHAFLLRIECKHGKQAQQIKMQMWDTGLPLLAKTKLFDFY